ncbi:MAG: alpha/beta hydrolase [Chloroflexota bacterium]
MTQFQTDLVTFDSWTLRVHPATETPPRLLLLIHGWTGDENSMWVFARNFPPRYHMLAPRAPHTAPEKGYTWRVPRPGTRGAPTLEDFRPAAEALIGLVDAYAPRVRVDAAKFDVMGFSQGAAVANALALLYPSRVRRAGILAGFMPLESEALIAQRPLEGKPFFVAHGTQDELVTVDKARLSIEALERAGAQVTYCEADVGHKVSADCLRALEKFFAD